MKIEWNIDDGYVNRRPNWTFEIPDCELDDFAQDLADDFRTESDIEEDIYEQAQEIMLQRISVYIPNLKDILSEVRERAAKIQAEAEDGEA